MIVRKDKYTYCIMWLRPDEWGFRCDIGVSVERVRLGVFQIARWINQDWINKEMAYPVKDRD